MMRVFLLAWSALWTVGLPLIWVYLRRRGRKDPMYTAHLAERLGRYGTTLPGAVWVHAVSLGEVRSAVPLIQALLAQGDRVVITLFTPAGRREAERVFAAPIAAGQLAAVWVPLETTWAYAGFFRAFQPRYGLVMEIEIWPRMVFAAKAQAVPLFMCNAQYPARSIARDGRGLRLRQQVMRGFAGAFVKSQLQADRFAAIGVRNIAVTGELRFDQPIPPALIAAGQDMRAALGLTPRRVIALASTVEGEDDIYIKAIAAILATENPPFIVYIPRRSERFAEVEQRLQAAGFSVVRRSALPARTLPLAGPLPDILLGDSMGEMYFYLTMADAVVVGGGFTPMGAHNIIEPLALRKPVITGPEIGTIEYPFIEAEAAGVAARVPDAAALAAALSSDQAPDPARIDAFFVAHSGGVARFLAALPQVLAQARG
ncbi:MAG: glycosyltransferase N-terminal domain-containing protein [Pseudomonadota bacterium]